MRRVRPKRRQADDARLAPAHKQRRFLQLHRNQLDFVFQRMGWGDRNPEFRKGQHRRARTIRQGKARKADVSLNG
ncbi:MAG: hypothetical protein M0Z56_05445 [Desulfobacteraceae bacterium]|nr:hypothetical protein [Desulfobacteraceae bacterium]